ncbi:hypothetical protein [Nocardioides sp. Leaf285]|uniref:hypothetical protein n=1 Tax=Nocardioides sp. Leaf285 TaxID=1736322 RepID=UPI0007025C1E|nr:hypothetical protein [Nocardioides sp. Leaf285]KQP63014.1 hypothetical protein ASF47_18555 [Nocardioides sp. Leaf285]
MTSSLRNASDPARARASLQAARLQRSEYLISLAEGLLTPLDLITAACEPSGRPLRRITLRQLVLAQPRVGKTRADAYLAALAERLSISENLASRNVAWLIDPRSGGRRIQAWLDVAHPREIPWPGFPLAPRPLSVPSSTLGTTRSKAVAHG